jgi:hypothetical protein
MAKHSPGPWSIHGDRETLIGDNSGKMMLATALYMHSTHPEWDRPLEQAQANARLIAAAPDMLKVLIQLTTEWERGREWISEDTIDQATRAIAKATSQQ